MDYTNENFETFQKRLAGAVSKDSLLWELRDAIFCEAFYGLKFKRYALFHIPFGQYSVFTIDWLRAVRKFRIKRFSLNPCSAHFLFCSPRNNHFNRIYPLFNEVLSEKSSQAWVSNPDVLRLIRPEHRKYFFDISSQWLRHVRIRDVFRARAHCDELHRLFPDDLSAWCLRKIELYFVIFLAWRRFWRNQLCVSVDEVYCTFEKTPVVKGFFFVAKELGVKKRVHWIHGLRHASIQSTLATELWCMTDGDVQYFQSRVPDYCTPHKKRNPEADMLVQSVGIMELSAERTSKFINFLFLGPGLETSYTAEMRCADLAVIKIAQRELKGIVSWRFRPHPSARERFKDELLDAGIEIDDFSDRDLIEDLKWAHAVGSAWSSLLLDVMETGRPIFWVQSEIRPLGGVDELIRSGIGIHVSASSISDQIQRVFGVQAQ